MYIGIAVFEQDWVSASPLFAFLRVFGIKIKNQDTFGDKMHEIKGTHLIINKEDSAAWWVDTVEFGRFLKSTPAPEIQLLHYDKLIYDIKIML